VKLRILGALLVVLGLFAAVASGGCQAEMEPTALVDDAGRQVNLSSVPRRIVSHVPPITETLFALGLGDRLVGRSDFCDYPPEAKEVPSIGNYFNPAIENIVAVEPDLVLTDGHSETIKQLDEVGIPFLVIDPKSIDDIFRSIDLLGRATGAEAAAAKLIADMKRAIAEVQQKLGEVSGVRVLYLIDATDLNNPWTAGPGSFVDYLISMAGGENVASSAPGAWAQLSVEEIVNSDPEIIILPGEHGTAFTDPAVLEEHPAWRETTAVREGRIFVIDGDLVEGYGPRIVQGLAELAKIIHPAAFQ
jgi:iron complex transport system substrate-binding protein